MIDCLTSSAPAIANSHSPLLVAQVSDTHLFGAPDQQLLGLQTSESLAAVLLQIKALPRFPDLFLLTGDLSQDDSAASYEMLQSLLSPFGVPLYWIPGNHDQPETMATVLQRSPFSAQKTFQAGGWRFLLLSSWASECVHGELAPATLDWLEQELSQSLEPTLIALHHPPLPIGSDWMNAIGLAKAEQFLQICDRYPQIRLVLFGHIHQEFNHQRNHVTYLGTPSTCIQFKPNSPKFALDEAHPGLRLVTLHQNGTWQTHIQRVDYTCDLDRTAAGY